MAVALGAHQLNVVVVVNMNWRDLSLALHLKEPQNVGSLGILFEHLVARLLFRGDTRHVVLKVLAQLLRLDPISHLELLLLSLEIILVGARI